MQHCSTTAAILPALQHCCLPRTCRKRTTCSTTSSTHPVAVHTPSLYGTCVLPSASQRQQPPYLPGDQGRGGGSCLYDALLIRTATCNATTAWALRYCASFHAELCAIPFSRSTRPLTVFLMPAYAVPNLTQLQTAAPDPPFLTTQRPMLSIRSCRPHLPSSSCSCPQLPGLWFRHVPSSSRPRASSRRRHTASSLHATSTTTTGTATPPCCTHTEKVHRQHHTACSWVGQQDVRHVGFGVGSLGVWYTGQSKRKRVVCGPLTSGIRPAPLAPRHRWCAVRAGVTTA